MSRFTRESLNFKNLNNINTKRSFSTVQGDNMHPPKGGASYLGSYLAGLWEGDGHISISKPDSKVQNLSLSITFHLKDLPLAQRLKDIIGFG